MGTISDKLTYLNTTKTMLRDSLNKFGSNILTNDTFRSYDTKLNDIYDKLPKITQSGAGFTLENVQNGLVDDFKMIGTDLEQDTTNGNQLIDFSSPLIKTPSSSTTSTFIEDTLVVSSTSATYNRVEWDILNILQNNPSKTLKFGKQSYSSTNNVGSVQLRIKINNTNTYVQILNNNYTIPSDTTTITEAVFQVYSNNSATSLETTTTIVKPLLYFDNNNTYEPYTGGIPSPNPDYPQEIKVVEGRQVITDKGKNLFTLDNLLTIIGQPTTTGNNQEFTISGAGNYNANVYKIGKIKDYIGKTLTFKAGFVSTSIQANTAYSFISCDNDGNNRVELSRLTLNDNNLTGTYTIPSSLDENLTLAIRLYGTSSTSGSTTYTNTQIEEGSIATDYEPYYEPVEYNIDLNLENIYLAKMPDTNYKNRIYKNNGNWYFEENVRKYIIDGTESWTTQSAYSGYYRYMFVLMENYKNDNLSYGVVGMNSHFIQRITQPHGDYEYLYLQAVNNNLLSVYIQIKNLSTIANFKTWLSENNVVVWYVLANPVITQITNTTLINQLEAISVHTGTNIIELSSNNNMTPQIEITRLKELERLT